MEFHKNGLDKTCRVCGERLNKAKGRERSYLVAEHNKELAEVSSIDASSDDTDTHPASFCHSCRYVLYASLAYQGVEHPTVLWVGFLHGLNIQSLLAQ